MSKIFFLLCIGTLVLSCNSKNRNSEFQNNLDAAFWICDDKEPISSDSLFYEVQPSPVFRKEFKTDAEIEVATLLITAAGYYKASINGNRIGENLLEPAWTDFSKRIYFSEYDITSQMQEGMNCLGVTLGNGFYYPLPLKMWGRRNLREVLPVGNPSFIAKLLIKYKNGSTEEIITDSTWKFEYGPIVKNNVYLGEVYDSRREIKDWNKSGFNDVLWKNAKVSNGPGGNLQKAFFPPVQVTDTILPVLISALNESVFIVDLGINFTGSYRIKLKGNKDDTLTFRFGERLYEDGTLNPMTSVCGQIKRKGVGGPGAPDIAWQTDSYILNDDSIHWFQPEFTFHTYRYLEVSGLKNKPQISDIIGLAINSNVSSNNSFSCSSDLLNSIQEATERTFLSNLVSVQSDCAAREKFGYGGDLNATSESFIYNFDMQDFYRKTIYDWVDAMNDSGFVDTAPFVGIEYCGISWESAFLTTQYNLYLYYNDIDIVKELYDLDKKWMEKVARIHPDKMVESGLSDHESLEPVPVELTGTCHYLQCAKIMAEFAALMGDTEAEIKYKNLAAELKILIRGKFWDKPVVGEINRQTLFSTLLYHEIIPESEMEAAKDSLLKALKNGPSAHFNTGIFGTKYILEALSKTGSADAVFSVVNSTEYPGWGFMIERGATTIWETWKESDNTYSNCHPMFGSVTEWFYRWLGGIQPDPEYPGFERFILSPTIPKDLDSVESTYHSPFGKIVSEWKKSGTNKVLFTFEIPEGSRATFNMPEFEIENISISSNGIERNYSSVNTKTNSIDLKSGDYNISVIYSDLER